MHQQQRLIEELWQRVHGVPLQPTPEQKHVQTLAQIATSLLKCDEESYRAGRYANEAEPQAPEPAPAPLPADPEAYADIDQVSHHLGVSKATIARMVRDDRFPQPDRLSAKRRGWKAGVVRSWPGYALVMQRRAERAKRPRVKR